MADKIETFNETGGLLSKIGQGIVSNFTPVKRFREQKALQEKAERERKFQEAFISMINNQQVPGNTEEEFENFRRSNPQDTTIKIDPADIGITGGSIGGVTMGQTPESKAKIEIQKEAAKIGAKNTAEAETTAPTIQLIGQLYQESIAELKEQIPNVGDKGFEGMFARGKAKIGKFKGEFPKTKAFESNIKKFATTSAKAAGEFRPTDADIRRFIESLPLSTGITTTEAEATTKMRNAILELESKGVKSWPRKIANELGINLEIGADIKGFQSTPSGIKFKIRKAK